MMLSEILDKAADIISIRGWCQGGFTPQESGVDLQRCPVCALGAINLAAGNDVNEPYDDEASPMRSQEAAAALAESLGMDIDTFSLPITEAVGDGWNDADGRTADEVIDTLREAAQHEREAGR